MTGTTLTTFVIAPLGRTPSRPGSRCHTSSEARIAAARNEVCRRTPRVEPYSACSHSEPNRKVKTVAGAGPATAATRTSAASTTPSRRGARPDR
jgi:hypothetical protein